MNKYCKFSDGRYCEHKKANNFNIAPACTGRMFSTTEKDARTSCKYVKLISEEEFFKKNK